MSRKRIAKTKKYYEVKLIGIITSNNFLPAQYKNEINLKNNKISIYFLDWKKGFRFVEPRYWDLIIINDCIMELDLNWLRVIQTHSRKWIVI